MDFSTQVLSSCLSWDAFAYEAVLQEENETKQKSPTKHPPHDINMDEYEYRGLYRANMSQYHTNI